MIERCWYGEWALSRLKMTHMRADLSRKRVCESEWVSELISAVSTLRMPFSHASLLGSFFLVIIKLYNSTQISIFLWLDFYYFILSSYILFLFYYNCCTPSVKLFLMFIEKTLGFRTRHAQAQPYMESFLKFVCTFFE